MSNMSTGGAAAAFQQSSSPYNTATTLAYSDLTAWFNLHLSMNDLLYPVTISANYSSTSTSSPSPPPSHGAELLEMPGGGGGLVDTSAITAKSFQPARSLTPISSLTRFVPTVISHCCTTVIHAVTSSPSRAPSFRRINSTRSHDSATVDNTLSNSGNQRQVLQDILETTNTHSGMGSRSSARNIDVTDLGVTVAQQHSPLTTGSSQRQSSFDSTRMDEDPPLTGFSAAAAAAVAAVEDTDSSKYDLSHDPKFRETFPPADVEDHHQQALASGMWSGNGLASSGGGGLGGGGSTMLHPELTLPQMFLSECKGALLYLVSPYYSASLTNCEDCEIVIGAVFGAVIVNGCERLKITCACRKLIVLNCLECEFNVATLSTTIIGGDSRGLTFGMLLRCFS